MPLNIFLALFAVLVFNWIPFALFALICRKRSDRFPGLEKVSETGPPPDDFSARADLAAAQGLIDAGKREEACELLFGSLKVHKSKGSSLETMALLADKLSTSLQELGHTKQAADVIGFIQRERVLRMPSGSDSLFLMALKEDPNLTPRMVRTLQVLQSNHTAFASAHLGRIFLATTIASVVGGVLLALALQSVGVRMSASAAIILGGVPWLLALSYRLYVIKTTKFELRDGALIFHHGGLSRRDPIYELYRLHDVTPRRSLMNRFSGDCELALTFDKEKHPIIFRGWVKVNEMDRLAMALREVSRALRTSTAIKGILT